jgi:hypothetical protein
MPLVRDSAHLTEACTRHPVTSDDLALFGSDAPRLVQAAWGSLAETSAFPSSRWPRRSKNVWVSFPARVRGATENKRRPPDVAFARSMKSTEHIDLQGDPSDALASFGDGGQRDFQASPSISSHTHDSVSSTAKRREKTEVGELPSERARRGRKQAKSTRRRFRAADEIDRTS